MGLIVVVRRSGGFVRDWKMVIAIASGSTGHRLMAVAYIRCDHAKAA